VISPKKTNNFGRTKTNPGKFSNISLKLKTYSIYIYSHMYVYIYISYIMFKYMFSNVPPNLPPGPPTKVRPEVAPPGQYLPWRPINGASNKRYIDINIGTYIIYKYQKIDHRSLI
jgi:hypothetical protein